MHQRATVYVCDSHRLVQDAIKALKNAGSDLRHLSVVGKDCCSADQSLNFCEDAASQKRLAAWVSFWHKIWSQLTGDAFLTISGIGPILVAGPLAQPMISAWTNLQFHEEISPLRDALRDWHISVKSISDYESALQAGHFLVVVHGDSSQVAKARETLDSSLFRKPPAQRDGAGAQSGQRH
ncbi:MAG TPA: hypothetical protein VE398_18250 [Acidobacteriota bacterium]|nr:hypothetical protein [Acidobacteriota bacterium]